MKAVEILTVAGVECVRVHHDGDDWRVIAALGREITGSNQNDYGCLLCPLEKAVNGAPKCNYVCWSDHFFVEARYWPIVQMRATASDPK